MRVLLMLCPLLRGALKAGLFSGLWQVLLYAYTNFTVVNFIDNEASRIKQINLRHIPLSEFDVNAWVFGRIFQ